MNNIKLPKRTWLLNSDLKNKDQGLLTTKSLSGPIQNPFSALMLKIHRSGFISLRIDDVLVLSPIKI